MEANGKLPEDSNERLAFIDMLPPDVSANVLMHMDIPGYETYDKIQKYAVKLVKTMQNQRCRPRTGVNMVDAYSGEPQEPEPAGEQIDDDDIDTDSGIAEIMALRLAPDEEHKDICASRAKKIVRRGLAGRFSPCGERPFLAGRRCHVQACRGRRPPPAA